MVNYLYFSIQDARVSNGVTFNGFLLAAQMETRAAMAAAADKNAAESVVGVDVFLMNDQKVTVRGKSILQTDEVLEVRIAQHLTRVCITSKL